MSKGPNTKDDPAEEDSERRLRRRRKGGGLRVPSDNVPRRPGSRPESGEFPPPEDPRLAAPVAYAFGDERSGRRSPSASEIPERPGEGGDSGGRVRPHDVDYPDAESEPIDMDDPPETPEPIEAEPTESTDRSAEMPAGSGAGDGDIDLTQIDEAEEKTPARPVVPRPARGEVPAPPPMSQYSGLMPDGDSSLDYPLLEDDYEDDRREVEPAEQRVSGGWEAIPPDSVDIPIEEVLEVGSGRVAGSGSFPAVADERGDGSDAMAARGAGGKRSADGAVRQVGRAQTMALADSDIEEMDEDGERWRMHGLGWTENPSPASSAPLPASPQVLGPPPEAKPAGNHGVRADGVVRPGTNRDPGDSGEIIDDELIEEIEESQRAIPHERARRISAAPIDIDSTVDLDGDEDVEELTAEAQEATPPRPVSPDPPLGSPLQAAPPQLKQKPPPAPMTARAAAAAAAAAAADPSQAKPRRRRGKPWFEDIFDEDYLRTLPFLTPQATQLEAQFVMDALGIAAGSQVLDVGCGYGRHAMELAARGYHVVGLDSSLPLLLRGADEAQRRGLTINFVHGDMRDMSFEAQFDGAYCLFSTFGYFDDETNKKTAQNICRALKPGARCVFEVLNRDYIIAELPLRVWWEGDGCVVLEEVDFNYFSSRLISNRSVVFDDGRQLEQEISIRSFGLHELGKLLHSAGFRVVEVSGNLITRGRFFGAQSRDIVVIAERREEKPGAPSDPGGRIP